MSFFNKHKIQVKDNGGEWKDAYGDDSGRFIINTRASKCNDDGCVFHASNFHGTIADDASVDILIQVGSSKNAHLLASEFIFQGYWEMELYENPTFTAAGTLANTQCMNRQLDESSDTILSYGPTLTADGDRKDFMHAEGGTGVQGAYGTQSSSVMGWILRLNEDYLLRLTNRSGILARLSTLIRYMEPD